MSSNTLAIATSLGVSPNTIARLERAGLDTGEQKRLTEIAVFAGVKSDELLPYVERGITLQTLSAAAQVRKDSCAAGYASFDDLVTLANSVGELSGERTLPAGMTIMHGRIVTEKEAAKAEVAMLEGEAKAAGFNPNAGVSNPESALPGATAAASGTSKRTGLDAKKLRSKVQARVQQEGAYTAQEQIMNALLEAVDDHDVCDLNRFIDANYDGDALKAYVALCNDEEEFELELSRFAAPTSRDLLLDDGDDDILADVDDALSLEDVAEHERKQDEDDN